MKRGKAALAAVVLVCFGIGACNAQQTALKAQAVVSATLKVAAAEETLVPTADQAAFTSWISLGNTLNGQLATCITNVSGLVGKSAKFASCFTTFASGLLSSAELAQLRLLSAGTQAKVQLYVTAIVTGIDIVVALQTPAVAQTQPTPASLHALCLREGLTPAEMRAAGL